ncbi:conserved hypothetical protein [Ricinus communis]|uniref:Uncharacterized protein n=1 Tax=Ricinus communis TaxID=3988 RepID=B9RXA1_RICCO|nr:conserved hypothetical protein [Ricinus communis]
MTHSSNSFIVPYADAAYHLSNGTGGTGMVILGEAGIFIGARTAPNAQFSNVEHAEAVAVEDGRPFPTNFSCKILLFFYCLNVIAHLSSASYTRIIVSTVIDNCCSQI